MNAIRTATRTTTVLKTKQLTVLIGLGFQLMPFLTLNWHESEVNYPYQHTDNPSNSLGNAYFYWKEE